MLRVISNVFLLLLFSSSVAVASDNNALPYSLIQQALIDNPGLQAAEAKWHISEKKIRPAASLDDPYFAVAFNNYPVNSFKGNETPMSGKIIKLAQKFPFPGKLGAKKEKARQMALWYKGLYEEGRITVAGQVADTYYQLAYLDHAITITEKNAALLKDFIRLTETNYSVGKGLQQEVLKAQVEHSKLTDKLITLRQKRTTTLARINSLLSRPPSTPLNNLPEISLPKVNSDIETMLSNAEKYRPMFQGYQAMQKGYEADIRLARLNYKPDFKLGVGYSFREPTRADAGTDFASIEFGINIPIFKEKRDDRLAAARIGLTMTKRQLTKFRDQIAFNLADAHASFMRAQTQSDLYKNGIIPQASQSLEASMSSYRVVKTTFLHLLDNLMTLYRYEIEYYQAVSDALRSYTKLQAETGVITEPASTS